MSQSNRPLSYAVTKSVLEHANPNERIRWSLQSPELERIEKRIPLKCKEIQINATLGFTKIDEVIYELSIKMQFDKGKIMPRSVRRRNERGGVTCDIDEQGRRVWATQNIVAPGDIMLDVRTDTNITDRPLHGFVPFIEFRIDGEVMQRAEYKNKTLLDAQRHLHTRLFGNRAHPINVKRLTFDGNVMRLPEGVKFHVKELDLDVNSLKYLDNLMTILAPDSFPLDYVRIHHVCTDWKEHNHPVIRNALTLSVWNSDTDTQLEEELLLEFLKSLRNPTIFNECALAPENHVALIEDWRINPRDVGSSITFERLYEEDVEEIYEEVMQHFEYRENEEEDVFISLNADLELRLTAGDDKGESARELIEADFQEDFSFFKMEVVPAGRV